MFSLLTITELCHKNLYKNSWKVIVWCLLISSVSGEGDCQVTLITGMFLSLGSLCLNSMAILCTWTTRFSSSWVVSFWIVWNLPLRSQKADQVNCCSFPMREHGKDLFYSGLMSGGDRCSDHFVSTFASERLLQEKMLHFRSHRRKTEVTPISSTFNQERENINTTSIRTNIKLLVFVLVS